MKVRLCEKCNHGEVCKIRTEQVGGCIYFIPKQAKSKMSINLDEEIALYKKKIDFYKDYPVTNEIMVRELEFILILLEQIKNSSKNGKWIDVNGDGSLWKCPNCGETSCCRGKYCSDCGARME